MASRNTCKVIPKFRSSTVVDFGALFPSGEIRLIARVEFPADDQLNDSLDASRDIAEILSKRLRKSIP